MEEFGDIMEYKPSRQFVNKNLKKTCKKCKGNYLIKQKKIEYYDLPDLVDDQFAQLISIPAVLGFMTPIAVQAGGEKHKGHHDHHGSHMNMGDSYPSTMFMGKTTFVLGGVDGVSDSGTVSYTHLTLPTSDLV